MMEYYWIRKEDRLLPSRETINYTREELMAYFEEIKNRKAK